MLTVGAIAGDIRSLTDKLFECGLAVDSNAAATGSTRGGGQRISYPGDAGLAEVRAVGGRVEEYLLLLQRRLFSVALIDGSLMQLAFEVRGGRLSWHRLAYVPCPIAFDPSETQDSRLDEWFNGLNPDEKLKRIQLRSTLRFDFASESDAADHPPVHLTVSSHTCRVPVRAPLSTGHFAKFVISHFYSDIWKTRPDLQDWACGEKSVVPWPNLHDSLFIDWERRAVVDS